MKSIQRSVFQCFFLPFLIFLMAACAKEHSVQINDDTLSFYYRDGTAKEILFAGSHDHFNTHPAIKGSDSIWQMTVPLKKEITYFYIVDGVVTVPNCQNTVLDDYGSKNCLYVPGM